MPARRRGGGGDTLIGVVAAVCIHGAVLGALLLFGSVAPWLGNTDAGTAAAATKPPEVREVAPLDPSCDGDALLRAAARATVCLTPFDDRDDAGACLDGARERLDIDMMLCHEDQMPDLPAVSLVEPQKVDKLPEIDAERLLDPLTPQEQQKFQQQLAQVQPPPPPPAAAPPPPPRNAQVIETTKPANEQAPDNAEYLAEYDSKVDKQHVAHGNPDEAMIDKPKPSELTPKPDAKDPNQPKPPEDQIGKKPDAPPVPGAFSMRKPGEPQPAEVEQDKHVAGAPDGATGPPGDGVARKKGDGQIDQERKKPAETSAGQGGAGGGTPRAPNLRPDDETLERMVGGGSVDHVEDIDEGDENAFNTKRWIYASFFNRMKRVVAQNWDPATVWQHEDPDGTHYGLKARVTTLRISLDAKGAVQKILVVDPSGVDALDDEAIRAFKAAEPFPNPPAALVDSDGFITFEFGFYFEIDSQHTAWKLYRSQ